MWAQLDPLVAFLSNLRGWVLEILEDCVPRQRSEGKFKEAKEGKGREGKGREREREGEREGERERERERGRERRRGREKGRGRREARKLAGHNLPRFPKPSYLSTRPQTFAS